MQTFEDRQAYDRDTHDMEKERGPKGEAFAEQVLRTCATDFSKPVQELDVFDLGSGYGHTALALAKRCRSVTGMEPCAAPLEVSQRLVTEANLKNLHFFQGTVETWKEREKYDLIILDNVLEHLPDQKLALERIEAALRPGGVLYMVVPNKLWPIEVHYHLPFLSYLPLSLANAYLRYTGKGTDYTDASFAPTLLSLYRLMNRHRSWSWRLTPPADLNLTTQGSVWHYRMGVAALRRFPSLWLISKAFLVVARKKGE